MPLKKLLCVALIAGSAASPVALAQSTADQGFYVGGHFGQSDVKELDETDTAWKFLVGYQLNRNFAVELGYVDFGDITLSGPGGSASFKADGFEFVGVGSLPVADRFSVYGKLGIYRADAEVQLNLIGFPPESASETNTDLTFGFGLRYDVARNIAIRGEWQRYGDVGDGATDIDVLSVGVVFRFQ